MAKVLLRTSDNRMIEMDVYGATEAQALNYVTNYGTKVRTFQRSGAVQWSKEGGTLVQLHVFQECKVAYIVGPNESLD